MEDSNSCTNTRGPPLTSLGKNFQKQQKSLLWPQIPEFYKEKNQFQEFINDQTRWNNEKEKPNFHLMKKETWQQDIPNQTTRYSYSCLWYTNK